MRPLSPTTEGLYHRILVRAFGSPEKVSVQALNSKVSGWTESNKALLRAAAKRRLSDLRVPEQEIEDFLRHIPARWSSQRTVEIPSEIEAQAFEQVVSELPPGKRAMALLPLAMGLRATEAVTLTRHSVERAALHGELTVLRKGGHEQALPASHARKLFEELLTVKALKRASLFESALEGAKPWKVTRDVLSTSKNPIGAYHQLHALIREAGERAGIGHLRPHKLRHAFATRMARDGAPLAVVQWMLGHANIQTTMRYVHPSALDAQKYMRPFH